MAYLVAAWSVHNPTVTNSIIMVSSPPTHPLPVSRPLRSSENMDLAEASGRVIEQEMRCHETS